MSNNQEGTPSSMLGIMAAVAEAVSIKHEEESHRRNSIIGSSNQPSLAPSSAPTCGPSYVPSSAPFVESSSSHTNHTNHSNHSPRPSYSSDLAGQELGVTTTLSAIGDLSKRPKLVLPDLTPEIQEDVENSSSSSPKGSKNKSNAGSSGSDSTNGLDCASEATGAGDCGSESHANGKSPKEKSGEGRSRGGRSGKLPLFVSKRPEWADYPLKDIVGPPHPNDVLCGRGGGSNNHPGNESFRELVNEVKVPYVNCPKREKPLIARRIVEAVRNQTPPGRFLQKDSETGLWNDIGDVKAREKTSQALREGAPIIRDLLQQEPGTSADSGKTGKNKSGNGVGRRDSREVTKEVVAAIKEAKKGERERGERNFDGGKERQGHHGRVMSDMDGIVSRRASAPETNNGNMAFGNRNMSTMFNPNFGANAYGSMSSQHMSGGQSGDIMNGSSKSSHPGPRRREASTGSQSLHTDHIHSSYQNSPMSTRLSQENRRASMGSLPPTKRFHCRGESDASFDNSSTNARFAPPIVHSMHPERSRSSNLQASETQFDRRSSVSECNPHGGDQRDHRERGGNQWSENVPSQSSGMYSSGNMNSEMPCALPSHSRSQTFGGYGAASAPNRRATMDFGNFPMSNRMMQNNNSSHDGRFGSSASHSNNSRATSSARDFSGSTDGSDSVPIHTVRKLLLGQLDPVQLALQILTPEEAALVARRAALQESFGMRGFPNQLNLAHPMGNGVAGMSGLAGMPNGSNNMTSNSPDGANIGMNGNMPNNTSNNLSNRSDNMQNKLRPEDHPDVAAQVSDDSTSGESYASMKRSRSSTSEQSSGASTNTAVSSLTSASVLTGISNMNTPCASNANMIHNDESSDECSRRSSNESSSRRHTEMHSSNGGDGKSSPSRTVKCSLPKKKRKFIEMEEMQTSL